jgi:hypothetical protein
MGITLDRAVPAGYARAPVILFWSRSLRNRKQTLVRPVLHGHNDSGRYVDIGRPLVGILRLFRIALTARYAQLANPAKYGSPRESTPLPLHLTVKVKSMPQDQKSHKARLGHDSRPISDHRPSDTFVSATDIKSGSGYLRNRKYPGVNIALTVTLQQTTGERQKGALAKQYCGESTGLALTSVL